MILLIILLVFSIALTVIGLILEYKSDDNHYADAACITALIAGALTALIICESRPNNTFAVKELPQIDTVITYKSVDQSFDTTYIYKFKE